MIQSSPFTLTVAALLMSIDSHLASRRVASFVGQVVGSESGGIYTTPLHFRNSGVVEVII